MDDRTRAYKEVQGKYDEFTSPQILKGLVFCGDCGSPLVLTKKVQGKYVYMTYQCRTHNMIMACPRKYVHEQAVINAVYDAVRLEIQKCADINGIIAKLNRKSSHKKQLMRFEAEIEEAEREIKRIISLRQAVYEDYAAKLLTLSEYQFATEKYNSDTAKQMAKLESARRDKEEYSQGSTPANKWVTAFSRFIDEKELTAEMAQALVERIEITNYNRVSITFKFRDELAKISEYSEVAE
jgi:hypothetical protein